MPDHALATAPWWKRLLTLEPALVRSVVGGVVYILALWGVDVAEVGDRLVASIIAALTIFTLVGAWIRSSVRPDATVVQAVEPDGTVIAGPASALPTGMVISRPGDSRDTIHPL